MEKKAGHRHPTYYWLQKVALKQQLYFGHCSSDLHKIILFSTKKPKSIPKSKIMLSRQRSYEQHMNNYLLNFISQKSINISI